MPKVKQWITDTKNFARLHRYVKTRFGFKRRLYNIKHDEYSKMASAERQAVNTRIQGTAGTYTEYVLAKIHDEMKRRNLKSRIFTTVHDSVLFDCHPDEVLEVAELAKEYLEKKWFKWQTVNMKTDVEIGNSWGELYNLEELLKEA
jgi:DNA polymerase-1